MLPIGGEWVRQRVGEQEMWGMKALQNYGKPPPLRIEKSNSHPPPQALRVTLYHAPHFRWGGTLYIHVCNA